MLVNMYKRWSFIIYGDDNLKHALTIAGSDSSGGAGIQADLKTFAANGVYGMSVITAITAQNTMGVFAVQDVSPQIIEAQIDAVFEDIEVHAVKIGMVSSSDSIIAIAKTLSKYKIANLVLDPVMISKSGYSLLKPDAIEALRNYLLSMAFVVTPNIPEAEVLAGIPIKSISDMKYAAGIIRNSGPEYVLLKGGHLDKDPVDILFDGTRFIFYSAKRIITKNTHGTGCTLSSAIAANIAKGSCVRDAVLYAKYYVQNAIRYSFSVGKGTGPTNHFYGLK